MFNESITGVQVTCSLLMYIISIMQVPVVSTYFMNYKMDGALSVAVNHHASKVVWW
jgi:hypothetical protein